MAHSTAFPLYTVWDLCEMKYLYILYFILIKYSFNMFEFLYRFKFLGKNN